MTADQRLDGIYDVCDELMSDSQWGKLNALLQCVSDRVGRRTIDDLLGYLTATLPAKSKLKHRRVLLEQTRCVIEANGENAAELLKGLE